MDPILHWIWQIVLSAFVAVVGVLIKINTYWVKKWMKQREDWEKAHDTKEQEFSSEGGVVTRDQFFGYCKDCKVVAMWNSLLTKGGAVAKDEFLERMELSYDKLLAGVKDLLDAHNKNAEANFAAIHAEIAGNAEKLNLVANRQAEVVQRIDRHIDAHSKNPGGDD